MTYECEKKEELFIWKLSWVLGNDLKQFKNIGREAEIVKWLRFFLTAPLSSDTTLKKTPQKKKKKKTNQPDKRKPALGIEEDPL